MVGDKEAEGGFGEQEDAVGMHQEFVTVRSNPDKCLKRKVRNRREMRIKRLMKAKRKYSAQNSVDNESRVRRLKTWLGLVDMLRG